MANCKKCAQQFTSTPEDEKFYERMKVPAPTLCPDCRQQRRAAFRNERNLYKRKSDLSGKPIISNISEEKPNKVYHSDEWWSDQWDPLKYGRSLDFNRPFFEQFKELITEVPRINLFYYFSENSDYSNHAYHNKNCYLIFNAAYNEDTHYSSNLMVSCRNTLDCMTAEKSELCYECIIVKNCFNCNFVEHSNNCSDSSFLFDCKGCRNCFMCWGLRNKQYHFKNRPLSRAEYEEKMKEIDLGSHSQLEKCKGEFQKHKREDAIHRNLHIENSENCTGDYIFNSKNVYDTYYADSCEDIRYCYDALTNKDCMDTYESSIDCELQYECYGCNESSNLRFCIITQSCNNMDYCDFCFNCHDCFGCTSLRHMQYCIFNKQYSEEEYMDLREKIIEYMKATGEFGEFFPVGTYPFTYNESIAQEFYPMTRAEVLEDGWGWKDTVDEKLQVERTVTASQLPDDIKGTSDEILNWAVKCEKTGRPFRIVPAELKFYRKKNLPIPRLHFDERHKSRIATRNPRKLWERNCSNCNAGILTTFYPDRPETVYCEKCYLESLV